MPTSQKDVRNLAVSPRCCLTGLLDDESVVLFENGEGRLWVINPEGKAEDVAVHEVLGQVLHATGCGPWPKHYAAVSSLCPSLVTIRDALSGIIRRALIADAHVESLRAVPCPGEDLLACVSAAHVVSVWDTTRGTLAVQHQCHHAVPHLFVQDHHVLVAQSVFQRDEFCADRKLWETTRIAVPSVRRVAIKNKLQNSITIQNSSTRETIATFPAVMMTHLAGTRALLLYFLDQEGEKEENEGKEKEGRIVDIETGDVVIRIPGLEKVQVTPQCLHIDGTTPRVFRRGCTDAVVCQEISGWKNFKKDWLVSGQTAVLGQFPKTITAFVRAERLDFAVGRAVTEQIVQAESAPGDRLVARTKSNQVLLLDPAKGSCTVLSSRGLWVWVLKNKGILMLG